MRKGTMTSEFALIAQVQSGATICHDGRRGDGSKSDYGKGLRF
jgi:hypothetical protein